MAKKSILNKKSIAFLEKYLNNAAPTGYEWEGQKIWMDYLKPYVDEFITDTYGTAVGVINPKAKYKVVIEGHADEISWYVNYISDNGLIYVIRNGGSDHQIAPSKIVNIHTKKGIVKGVFGWPAIHTRSKAKEEPPKLDNIFIDCGCTTKEEVEKYKKLDPLELVLATIQKNKYASSADLKKIEEKVEAIVEESVKFAEDSPLPEPEAMYEDIYAEPNYPFIKD